MTTIAQKHLEKRNGKSVTFWLTILGLASFVSVVTASAKNDEKLATVYQVFQRGDYEKAGDLFAAAQDDGGPPEAYVGLARVRMETGKYDEAERVLQTGLKVFPDHPGVLTALGDLQQRLGQFDRAQANYRKALGLAPDHLRARLQLGKLQAYLGERPAAKQTLGYFIDYYYRNGSNLDGEGLQYTAEACLYLDRFRDANRLFQEATAKDSLLWQAYIPWGNLFLSKYNEADAQSVFEDALKINPNAAEAHLGLAKCLAHSDYDLALRGIDRALSINASLVEAYDFKAELQLQTRDFEKALGNLDRALKINPKSLSTHSLRALCYFLNEEHGKFEAEVRHVLNINPQYGDVYYQIAEALSRQYLFRESVEYYQKAIALDPDHPLARAGLGTSLSRLGQEKIAKTELEQAFKKDPYNKYVSNLLTLFDEFPKYKTHETEHFILRIHKRDDPVLAGYATDLVRQSFADLARRYTFERDHPVTIEIFPEHDDFAVRCFGLPGAQAFLGICFGDVVAMDSPRARVKGDFVWGETLWHELVHVTHLRMTGNRIPRWLAEGIAVYETSTARPYWDMNLDIPFLVSLENDRLLPLKDLDSGFNRPTNPGQVTLSYYQASKVVEFIVEKYGHDKLIATFPEFKAGKETPEVIEAVFGKSIDAFDAEFRTFVREKYRLNQVDFTYDSGQNGNAGEDTETALLHKLEQNPNNPFLNFRVGVYFREKGRNDDAVAFLKKARELFPRFVQHENPYTYLAEIYLEKGEKDLALQELQTLTSLNGKDLGVLKKLANLGLELERYDVAAEALQKAIYISPFDSEIHKKLGAAYLAEKNYGAAIAEFQVLILTRPQDLAGAHYQLANAYLLAGRKNDAKTAAMAALEIAPGYEQAQEVLLKCLE